MLFTLEAVFAKHGDALILHYGPFGDPAMLLIDGGAPGAWGGFLKPRFLELRDEFDIGERESFPLEMVMVSHVDSDHIAGVLDLFDEQVAAHDGAAPLPFEIKRLWHNSFDDILDNTGEEVVSELSVALEERGAIDASPLENDTAAVIASVAQGRNLRKAAEKLGMKINDPFEGLVMAPAAKKIELGHGLTFHVLGPDRERVEDFRKRWDKDLAKILEKEQEAAESASFADNSPFNLASIVVLAEMEIDGTNKTMLLTGDARGDFILEGLEAAGLWQTDGPPLHVDVLKVPHHGSDRNVTKEFFEQVTADDYLVSGDGFHGNPEPKMLQMLADARDGAPYRLHVTFAKNAHETETSESRKKHMKEIQHWLQEEAPDNCEVIYRDAAADHLSVTVDLGEGLFGE